MASLQCTPASAGFVSPASNDRQNGGVRAEANRSEIRISVVMFALTVTAGAVDAVTFLGLGRALAALATGNVLLLGFGVANAPGITIARPAEALAAFVAGVATAHAARRTECVTVLPPLKIALRADQVLKRLAAADRPVGRAVH